MGDDDAGGRAARGLPRALVESMFGEPTHLIEGLFLVPSYRRLSTHLAW
jgi:hypothetical protein